MLPRRYLKKEKRKGKYRKRLCSGGSQKTNHEFEDIMIWWTWFWLQKVTGYLIFLLFKPSVLLSQ